jgi:cobalt-precorrin-5B (C1)-methyltransferase
MAARSSAKIEFCTSEPHLPFRALLVLGHPGKLAKLADGQWDTHSARSQPPVEAMRRLGLVGPEWDEATTGLTVEGLFAALALPGRTHLAETLASRSRAAVSQRTGQRLPVAVFLVDMAGACLGHDGDLSPWR